MMLLPVKHVLLFLGWDACLFASGVFPGEQIRLIRPGDIRKMVGSLVIRSLMLSSGFREEPWPGTRVQVPDGE